MKILEVGWLHTKKVNHKGCDLLVRREKFLNVSKKGVVFPLDTLNCSNFSRLEGGIYCTS